MKVNISANDKTITERAVANITGREGKVTGKARFTEYLIDDYLYVHIALELKGVPNILTPGKHAVHIHEKADCSGEFKCAGGHFDPGPASNSDPDVNHPYHAGDLPNITINQDGTGHLEAIATRITLSEGPLSILHAEGGTSLMIHANEDPYQSGEHGSGVSGGPRLACGIIKADS